MGQDLLALVKGHEATVRKQVEQASSLPSFLRAFVPLVQRLSQASVLCTTEQNQVSWLRNLSTAAHVVQQLSDLGWEKVMAVDDALRSIEVGGPINLCKAVTQVDEETTGMLHEHLSPFSSTIMLAGPR
jgi:hypothetical protein